MPLVSPSVDLTPATFFNPEDGIIAKALPGFIPREGQQELSETIMAAKNTGGVHIIGNAPTGFGKSFSALVPAIIRAVKEKKRTVVSTETIALQDQYVLKDLPFLQKACAAQGIHFTFAVAKGRTNYVCKNKLDDASFATRGDQLLRWAGLQQIDVHTGDRASVPFSINDNDWRAVGADDDCERKSCPFYGEGNKGHSDCFVFDAARKYKEAEIVVTNHTMFLLDAQNKPGSLFGAYDMAIIDEGHTLPEHAQKVWGMEIRPRTVSKTLKLVDKMLRRAGVTHFESGFLDYWENMEDRLFLPFRRFHNHNSGNTSFYLKNISEYVDESKIVATEMIERLKDENKLLGQFTADESGNELIEAGRDKIYKMVTTLKRIYGDEIDPEHVDNWVSYLEVCRNPNNQQKFCVLHLKPIDVAPLIRGLILDGIPNVTFMSATMKLGPNFGFMKAELGLPKDNTIEFVGKTPFNYADCVEGYFPTDLPDPDAPDYIEKLAKRIRTILIRRKGSALVLFTSNKTMQGVYEWIMDKGCPHTCFMQGQGSKAHLLEEFKKDIESCLFATRSFFAGIDVPGDALRTVILTKAPFRVPSDPLFKAKCDKLKSKGINDFSGYSMPLMLMDFLQAFGRLIRTTTDHGLFCCLDSKANKKAHGGEMKRVLPRIRFVDVVDKVA